MALDCEGKIESWTDRKFFISLTILDTLHLLALLGNLTFDPPCTERGIDRVNCDISSLVVVQNKRLTCGYLFFISVHHIGEGEGMTMLVCCAA